MLLLQTAEWLEATALARWVQESQYGFAIVVAVHILALTLSVGTLIWFDLRLLGVSMRRMPVSKLYRRLMPLILTGFAVVFVSGGILLAAYATAAYGNLYSGSRLPRSLQRVSTPSSTIGSQAKSTGGMKHGIRLCRLVWPA